MRRVRAKFIVSEPFEEFEILYGWAYPPSLWKPWVFWFKAEDGRQFWLPIGAYISFRRTGKVSSLFGEKGDFRFRGRCFLEKV